MAKKSDRTPFFIALLKHNGEITGHAVAEDPDLITAPAPEKPAGEMQAPSTDARTDFRDVFHNFITTMEYYRHFIPLTVSFAPFMSSTIAERNIGGFAHKKGTEGADLSTEDRTVYELDWSCYREFMIMHEEVKSAIEETRRLPEIVLIGLARLIHRGEPAAAC